MPKDEVPESAAKNDLPSKVLAAVRKSARTTPNSLKRTYRGRPDAPQYSGPRADDRDPVALSAGIGDLVNERGWQRQSAVGSVTGRWREIVGDDIASHVTPEAFEETTGQLVVRADSSMWATQITLLVPQILVKLDTEIGVGVVKEIHVEGAQARRSQRR